MYKYMEWKINNECTNVQAKIYKYQLPANIPIHIAEEMEKR